MAAARILALAVLEGFAETGGSLVASAAAGDGRRDAPRLSVDLTRASMEELDLAPGRRVHPVIKTQSCRVLSA